MRGFWIVALLVAGAMPVLAAPRPGSTVEAPAQTTLVLEIWVNGQSDQNVVPVTVEGSRLSMRAADLKEAGIAFDTKGDLIPLDSIAGLVAKVEQDTQRLLLTVDAAKLPAQRFDLRAATAQSDDMGGTPASGAILRYDLAANVDDLGHPASTAFIGGAGTLDLFMPLGRLTMSGYFNAMRGSAAGARLDTALHFDHRESVTRLVLGDAITGGPAWSRNVRFGGIQYASDFSLRPDLVTMPLPDFFGSSQVPGTVDVFNGATHVFEKDIAPGPFELRNLPIVTGGGTATIVTRDVLGRQTSQTISLYTHPDLLAPGLSSFTFDAGFLRTGYGLTNFGYDTPVASGTWRQGLNKTLTVQAHAQASSRLGLLSGGLSSALGDFGLLSADAAASHGEAGNGYIASLGGEARLGPVNFNLSTTIASDGFRDLASMGAPPPPRARFQAGVSINADNAGVMGLNWLSNKNAVGPATQYISASYSVPLFQGFMGINALYDVRTRKTDLQLSLMIPLGQRAMASVSAQAAGSRQSFGAFYDRPASSDGGMGYRMMAQWDEKARLQGDANWIGRHVGLNGGVFISGDRQAIRGGMQGALVMMDGEVFAAHEPGEAVALVDTGAPRAHVYRENRDMGPSDERGRMLLTGLDAYAPNHITVDPRDYPFDTVVENTDRLVRPPRRGGVLVSMAPTVRHSAVATITGNMQVPLGTVVTLDDKTTLAVGRNGQIFIPDLARAMTAVVELDAARCYVRLDPAQKREGMAVQTDPMLCLREARNDY